MIHYLLDYYPLWLSIVFIGSYYCYHFLIESDGFTPEVEEDSSIDEQAFKLYEQSSLYELKNILLHMFFRSASLSQTEFRTVVVLYLKKTVEFELISGFSLLFLLLFLEDSEKRLFIKKTLTDFFVTSPGGVGKLDTKKILMYAFNSLDRVYCLSIKENVVLKEFLETIHVCMYKKKPNKQVLQKYMGMLQKENSFSSLGFFFK